MRTDCRRLAYQAPRYEIAVGSTASHEPVVYRIDARTGMVSACTLRISTAAAGEVGHDWAQFLHDTGQAGYRGYEILEYLQTQEGGEMMCSPWGARTIRAKTPKAIPVATQPRSEPTQTCESGERKSTERQEEKSH
jgi:hypothetical protein